MKDIFEHYGKLVLVLGLCLFIILLMDESLYLLLQYLCNH